MPSDQLVDSKSILEALAELKRTGINRLMENLESTEPDLASFVMEELSLLHKRLLETGGRPIQVRRLQRQVESLVVVSIGSLRKAHHQLWRTESNGTPLGRLDAALDENKPPLSSSEPG